VCVCVGGGVGVDRLMLTKLPVTWESERGMLHYNGDSILLGMSEVF
jgi:hypothetical protein